MKLKTKKISVMAVAITTSIATAYYCINNIFVQKNTANSSASISQQSTTNETDYQKIITLAYKKYRNNNNGHNANYIPELAKMNTRLFGITLITTSGKIYQIGDSNHPFPIESISKAFTLSLAMNNIGDKAILQKIGAQPTGMPFDSITAIKAQNNRTGNAFVNAGAIATVSLLRSIYNKSAWKEIHDNMNLFSADHLKLNEKVYSSETSTNQHNKLISHLLKHYGKIYSSPKLSVDLYTKSCSLNVSARQLAIMAGVLANHGINPLSHKKLLSKKHSSQVLAMMAANGMYNNSGNWMFETGVPAKSGVGGGLIAVVPGKFAIATFSPPLDQYGNSVRGQLAIKYILSKLHERAL